MTARGSDEALEVVVSRTWDGKALQQPVRFWLRMQPDVLVIDVDAPFYDDPAPRGPPGPTDRLWNHEVVEVFLLDASGTMPHYVEIELGPHGHHLILQLRGVRAPYDSGAAIDWRTVISGDRWTGAASVPRPLLPDPITHFNAFAIHGTGRDRTYLAAFPVPGEAPDFHRLGHFAPWPR